MQTVRINAAALIGKAYRNADQILRFKITYVF